MWPGCEEPEHRRILPNRKSSLQRLIRKLQVPYGETACFACEAAPSGCGVYRGIIGTGHDCQVVAPGLIPRKPGDRVKTDRRAAVSLAPLQGVGSRGRSPAGHRRIPNWIGPPGCTADEARFVPIEANRLPAAADAWERYRHAPEPDRLVRLATLQAEFEALHPFLDGNGRLGRIPVPLCPWEAGMVRVQVPYISAYFEARHDAYCDALMAVPPTTIGRVGARGRSGSRTKKTWPGCRQSSACMVPEGPRHRAAPFPIRDPGPRPGIRMAGIPGHGLRRTFVRGTEDSRRVAGSRRRQGPPSSVCASRRS